MKKTIWLVITILIIGICLIACSSEKIPENLDSNEISNSEYSNLFGSYSYDSIEDFYRGLRDFEPFEIEEISFRENRYMENTRSRTHVTEAEEINGIFGNMRNQLLVEKTIMVPYYRNKPVPRYSMEEAYYILLSESYYCRKPWIEFACEVNGVYFGFDTMYYDKKLLDEANQKGASWLMSQIDHDGLNVYNYKQHNAKDGTNVIVYEKEFRLGDRDVLAMIMDCTLDEFYSLGVYFVYDDILVCVWNRIENLETILPDITFREVNFTTNTPLRAEPGREGTKYSTRDVLEIEEIKKEEETEKATDG